MSALFVVASAVPTEVTISAPTTDERQRATTTPRNEERGNATNDGTTRGHEDGDTKHETRRRLTSRYLRDADPQVGLLMEIG